MKKFQNHDVFQRVAIWFLFDIEIECEHQNVFLRQSKTKFWKMKNKTLFIKHKHIQINILIEIDD